MFCNNTGAIACPAGIEAWELMCQLHDSSVEQPCLHLVICISQHGRYVSPLTSTIVMRSLVISFANLINSYPSPMPQL